MRVVSARVEEQIGVEIRRRPLLLAEQAADLPTGDLAAVADHVVGAARRVRVVERSAELEHPARRSAAVTDDDSEAREALEDRALLEQQRGQRLFG